MGHNFGTGADGEVNFTTTTKTYGNLVENVDYKVIDNDLFLKVDKVFNFTNFTLGSGTTLKSLYSNTGTAIYIKCTGTATIDGDVICNAGDAINLLGGVIRGQDFETTWNSGTDDGTISTPGVANGGSGGSGGDVPYGGNVGGSGGNQGSGYGGGGGGGAAVSFFGGDWVAGSGGWGGGGGLNIDGGNAVYLDTEDTANNGNNGSNSGGGSGAVSLKYDGSGASVTSGGGAETHGSNGGDATRSGSGSAHLGGGGGGGGGGLAGYSGVNFYLNGRIINFTGSIDTGGTNGGNGGNGGNGIAYHESTAGAGAGGGGGGGGGGGHGGDIYFRYTIITNSGDVYYSAGTGGSYGTGGSHWYTLSEADDGENGNAGSNGDGGSFSTLQVILVKINIGDVWKDATSNKINIGDSWKDIAGIKINIGDVWKTIF
jgi:hypothetical protein